MNGKLKKTICAVALAGAVGMLAGCAAPAADTAANSVASGSQTPASAAPVSVTFPKSYFIDAKTSDDATAMLQQLGCTDIVAGNDGSYTAHLAGDAY